MKKNGLAAPSGQGDQQGRPGQRDGPFDDELGRPERVRGQQLVDEDEEQRSERQQDQDRLLRVGPQAGRQDDRGGDQDEDPADDPDDAVVGLGGAAAVRVRADAAGHGRGGEATLQVRPGRRVVAGRSPGVRKPRDEDGAQDHEIADEGDDDQGEQAFHEPILAGRGGRSGGDRSASVRSGTGFRERSSASRTGRSA